MFNCLSHRDTQDTLRMNYVEYYRLLPTIYNVMLNFAQTRIRIRIRIRKKNKKEEEEEEEILLVCMYYVVNGKRNGKRGIGAILSKRRLCKDTTYISYNVCI